jgi:alkanesulfonate monooxygenase
LPLGHGSGKPKIAVNTGPFGETIANDLRPQQRQASES